MMNLLKSGTKYGAKVGNKTVFARQGAIDAYKAFCEVVYKNGLTMEGASVLGEVEEDMVRIGFDWDELEEIELEYLK